jgi:hypothetical protein
LALAPRALVALRVGRRPCTAGLRGQPGGAVAVAVAVRGQQAWRRGGARRTLMPRPDRRLPRGRDGCAPVTNGPPSQMFDLACRVDHAGGRYGPAAGPERSRRGGLANLEARFRRPPGWATVRQSEGAIPSPRGESGRPRRVALTRFRPRTGSARGESATLSPNWAPPRRTRALLWGVLRVTPSKLPSAFVKTPLGRLGVQGNSRIPALCDRPTAPS